LSAVPQWTIGGELDQLLCGCHSQIHRRMMMIGEPDTPSNRFAGEHDGSDWLTAELQQGWISAFVGGELCRRETDRAASSMIVDGKVDEASGLSLDGAGGSRTRR